MISKSIKSLKDSLFHLFHLWNRIFQRLYILFYIIWFNCLPPLSYFQFNFLMIKRSSDLNHKKLNPSWNDHSQSWTINLYQLCSPRRTDNIFWIFLPTMASTKLLFHYYIIVFMKIINHSLAASECWSNKFKFN